MAMGLVLIWLSVVLLWYYLSRRRLVVLGSKIPGPTGYPFIGNALLFLGKPENVFKRMGELSTMYTRMAALWIGPQLHVALFDPRDIEVVLRATRNVEKANEYEFLRPWLGDSLLLSTGSKFKQVKKLIMPSFHANNLKCFLDVFNQHSKNLVKILEEELDKDEFDINPHLTLCTMNVLLETVLGVSKKAIGEQAIIYSRAVERLGRLAFKRVYKLWLHPDIFFQYSSVKEQQDKYLGVVNPLTERVIQERKKECKARKARKIETGEEVESQWSVFLDNLLSVQQEGRMNLSDEDIKDEVMTMMFAGQDTTTVSVGFALSLIGIYPLVQDKIMAELDEIFGESNRSVTYEDVQQLKYLEQVIQETWRLYPPIPLIAKRATEDIQLENCVLPKHCGVPIIIMILHRNPNQYPNPDRFDPDNFLPERIKARHPYSFIPFSAGYRTCVGSRYAMILIKVILATLLRNFRISSKRREKDFVLAAQTVLKRREGFPISIKLREKTTVLNTQG